MPKSIFASGQEQPSDGFSTVSLGSSADIFRTAAQAIEPVIDYGAARDFHIDGGPGDDVLFGSSGNDIIHGGAGNDLLVGGAGKDIMTGGEGNDTYRFAVGDSGLTTATADHITDFKQDAGYVGYFGDRIEVNRYVMSHETLAFTGPYGSIEQAAEVAARLNEGGQAGSALVTDWATGNAYLFLDQDGNGTFETGIVIEGAGDWDVTAMANHNLLFSPAEPSDMREKLASWVETQSSDHASETSNLPAILDDLLPHDTTTLGTSDAEPVAPTADGLPSFETPAVDLAHGLIDEVALNPQPLPPVDNAPSNIAAADSSLWDAAAESLTGQKAAETFSLSQVVPQAIAQNIHLGADLPHDLMDFRHVAVTVADVNQAMTEIELPHFDTHAFAHLLYG